MLFSPGPGPVSSPAMRLHTNCPQGNKFNVTFCIFPFARLDAVEKHVKWMSILLSLGLHHDLSKHQRPRVEPGVSYIAEWSPWPDLQQLQWKLPTTILDLIISIPSVNSTTTGQRRRLWAQDAHHDNAAAHWHPRRQTPIGGEGRSTFVMGGGGGRTGLPVSNLDKRPGLSAGFQLAGSSKAFCPSTAFFFSRPLGWRLATSADDETGEDSESPTVQRMGGGREEKRWLGGFPDSLTSRSPFSSRGFHPVLLCDARLTRRPRSQAQVCIYTPRHFGSY